MGSNIFSGTVSSLKSRERWHGLINHSASLGWMALFCISSVCFFLRISLPLTGGAASTAPVERGVTFFQQTGFPRLSFVQHSLCLFEGLSSPWTFVGRKTKLKRTKQEGGDIYNRPFILAQNAETSIFNLDNQRRSLFELQITFFGLGQVVNLQIKVFYTQMNLNICPNNSESEKVNLLVTFIISGICVSQC